MKYDCFLMATSISPADYKTRQFLANQMQLDLYVEFHLNARENDRKGTGDNPALGLVAENASQKSRAIATDFANAIAETFVEVPRGQLVELQETDRGYYNLVYTAMPAFLIEPLFISEPEQSGLVLELAFRKRIAKILDQTIRKHFPDGAKIAFSLGHKYKKSAPRDRGAGVVVDRHGDGSPVYHPTETEASLCESIMQETIDLLEVNEQWHNPEPVEPEPVEEPTEYFLPGEWSIIATPAGILAKKL